MSTVQELAKELGRAFVHDKRNDGKEFVKLAENSPQWMTDVIREAHGETLPDDTIYEFIERCADAIADSDDANDAILELEPDSYTHDLTAWLDARVDHVYYLTQALEELAPSDGFKALAIAQQLQIQEVGQALIAALERLADESEAA